MRRNVAPMPAQEIAITRDDQRLQDTSLGNIRGKRTDVRRLRVHRPVERRILGGRANRRKWDLTSPWGSTGFGSFLGGRGR